MAILLALLMSNLQHSRVWFQHLVFEREAQHSLQTMAARRCSEADGCKGGA